MGFWDLFTPLVEIEAPEEERGWINSVLVRASVGVSMASFFYLLYAHSPGTGIGAWGLRSEDNNGGCFLL